MKRNIIDAAWQAHEEALELEECLENNWPNIDISVGMLVVASPGHIGYELKANQLGLITKQEGHRYDVFWTDGELEQSLSKFHLDTPTMQDPDKLAKLLKQSNQITGDDPSFSGLTHVDSRYQIGDLVVYNETIAGVEPDNGFERGPGLVIDIDALVVPPKYYVLWGDDTFVRYEDELIPYDEK